MPRRPKIGCLSAAIGLHAYSPTSPLKTMKHLVLVRHGESELNVLNRNRRVFCGQFETPLTSRGREQALEAADRILRHDYLNVQTAVSSPLERAKETLELILSRLRQEIDVLPAIPPLMERSHGLFEGKSDEEAFLEHPAYRDDPNYNCFMDHFHQHAPEGESLAVVTARVWPMAHSMLDASRGDLLVVSHYNPIRCIVGRAMEMSEAEVLRLRVPNALPIVLRWNGRFELLEWPAMTD
jgi:broad specificity phosphatase PhoE